MKQYDLEAAVLSCLLQKPELIKELKLEDKHFVSTQRIWQFMKAFYDKFETFDISLMYSVCKDKFRMISYFEWLIDFYPPTKTHFEKMQDRIIEMYEQTKKEEWITEKVFALANQLYVKNISFNEFLLKIDSVLDDANIFFKDDKK